jgi:hypothetical protein
MRAAGTAPLDQLRGRPVVLLSTAVAGAADILGAQAAGTAPLRLLGTAAGLWLIIGAPTALWLGTSRRLVTGLTSALLLSVGFALMTDFVVLLAVNYLPQLAGYGHPLTRVPTAAGFAFADILIGAFSPRSEPLFDGLDVRGGLPSGVIPVAAGGTVCILLAIAGATRLNNGFGPGVSITGYIAVAAFMVMLIMRRHRYSGGALAAGVFCASAAMLLLTSLRGWLITGHDIQTEYEYFRLNYGGQRWEISLYHSAYNACLSITLLPIAFVQLTSISGVGVFKIVLPLLFALAPVALFHATNNLTSRLVSLLSAALFISFPAFYTDMPYLGRQEVAFVVLGSALVVATDRGGRFSERRLTFTVLLAGVVLAHYSTAYVLLIVLGTAAAFDTCWRWSDQLRRPSSRGKKKSSFVRLWMPLAAAAVALLWAGPITHTSGQLSTTISATLAELQGHGNSVGSSATSGSLLGGTHISDQQRLSAYRDQTLTTTAQARTQGDFIPLSTVNAYPTSVVPQPDMPLTGVGRALKAVGIPVSTLNGAMRSAIAAGLQLLIVIGMLVSIFARQRAFKPDRDQIVLAVGTLSMLALLTLVPQLSVDYGVLRAFQQGIFFVGPFMAAGLIWALRWTRSAAVPAVCAVTAGIMLDLSGALPQLTGGYPAQLALNNSGQYYDLYYPTQAEQSAAAWLQGQVSAAPAGTGGHSVQASLFTFNEIQSTYTGPAVGTVFPTMISPSNYVLLGPDIADKDQDTVNYRGTLVAYRYPRGLLDATKDEVYSSSGVEIYR